MTVLPKLFQALKDYSSRVCVESQNSSYGYDELLDEIDRWSFQLEGMSLQTGSVVGLRADYSLSTIAAFFALLARNVIPALIPRDRPAEEYLYHCHACGLLELRSDGTQAYTAIPPSDRPQPLLQQARAKGEGAFVVFTSGSTGTPKAALHSLDCFLRKFEKPGRSLRTLAFLLFDHIGGLDTLFYTLRNGGTLVLTYRRDPSAILLLIASKSVEVLPTSPSFLRLLCSWKESRPADLQSLKVITYGAEPMDARTLQRVNQAFPNVQIAQKYGTTELGSPPTISRSNDSMWLKFKGDGSEVRILDGILWFRSKGTMLGYLNAPSSVTSDGWYCTGDLVELDGDWIHFLGRADEIIMVGGEKVSPSKVEAIIRELVFVADVLVFGEPHAIMGRVVAARVTVSSERPAPPDAPIVIRRHCRDRAGPYHVPVRVTLVYEDPQSLLGYRLKIQRQGVRYEGDDLQGWTDA